LYACTKYNPRLLYYSKESKLSRVVCCALLKMIASGMSLTWSVTGCMTKEQNNDFHRCRGNQRTSSLFVEENDYSALFYSGANNLLAFWLYLVVRSYFWLNKKVYFFSSCPVKPKDKSFFIQRKHSKWKNRQYQWCTLLPEDKCSKVIFDIVCSFIWNAFVG
jgi:hypothetical protein